MVGLVVYIFLLFNSGYELKWVFLFIVIPFADFKIYYFLYVLFYFDALALFLFLITANVAHNRKFTGWFGLRKIERSEYANQTTL